MNKYTLELFDVTAGDSASLLTKAEISGPTDNSAFSFNSSNLQNYRAPMILSANYTGDYVGWFGQGLSLYRDTTVLDSNYYWQYSPDYYLFAGAAVFDTNEPPYRAAIYKKFETNHRFETTYIFPVNTDNKLATLGFYRMFGQPYDLETAAISNDKAWISYDVSGVNTNKVFAYSISILDYLSGNAANILKTGVSGSQVIGMAPQDLSGYCDAMRLFFEKSGYCQSPEAQDGPNVKCLPGQVTSGQLQAAISGAIQESLMKMIGKQIPPTSSNDFQNTQVASAYQVYTGMIQFNTPQDGDGVTFKGYFGNYTGDYSGSYNTAPPYELTEITFTKGYDYGSIDDLVWSINTYLSGMSYQTWHKYPCTSQEPSGYFEYGPLLEATKIDDNHIFLVSKPLGEAGHFDIQTFTGENATKFDDTLNIWKFLLPKSVKLQGRTTGDWVDIDSHSGIDWASLMPTKVTADYPSAIASGNNPPPKDPDDPNKVKAEVSGSGNPILIYSLTVTGEDSCGKPFSDVTQFFNDQVNNCKSPEDQDDKNDEDLKNALDNLNGGATPSGNQLTAAYLKTGWKFQNIQPYDAYRVYIGDFYASAQGSDVLYSNEFSVANVNLYGLISGTDNYTQEMCLMGASYKYALEGYATGTITGTASGYASAATSGMFVFDIPVTGTPSNVRFNNTVAYPTSTFTGFLKQTVVGVQYYNETVGGYFYAVDASGAYIYTTAEVSGWVTGSGHLYGGPYAIVDSGFLQTGVVGTQYVYTPSAIFQVSGEVYNIDIPFYNRLGFAYLSGSVSQVIISGGQAIISMSIVGTPDVAYQYGATGYDNAVAWLNYNAPAEDDMVMINGIPIFYSQQSGFGPSSYYDSIGTLVNIINSGQDLFSVSATQYGNSVALQALVSGSAGNSITVLGAGSTGTPTFTTSTLVSGHDYYKTMIPTSPFSGYLNATVYATGYASAIASGEITGDINYLSYTRTFTGVWDLITGGLSYRSSGYLSGNTYVAPQTVFYSTPTYFTLSVSYNNLEQNMIDLALLTISGRNFGSGIQYLLSGQP